MICLLGLLGLLGLLSFSHPSGSLGLPILPINIYSNCSVNITNTTVTVLCHTDDINGINNINNSNITSLKQQFLCNLNGYISNGTCVCYKEYASYKPLFNNEQCNYKKISNALLLMLSIPFGCVGVVYFVLGDIGIGILQILFTYCVVIAWFTVKKRTVQNKLDNFILSMSVIGVVLWWIVLIVKISVRKMKDSNGIETY